MNIVVAFLKNNFRTISALIILVLISIIAALNFLVIPGGSILDEPCCTGLEPGSPMYVECQKMSAFEKLVEKCFGIE